MLAKLVSWAEQTDDLAMLLIVTDMVVDGLRLTSPSYAVTPPGATQSTWMMNGPVPNCAAPPPLTCFSTVKLATP